MPVLELFKPSAARCPATSCSKQAGKSIWTVNWSEPLSRSRERGARPGATCGLKRFPDYTKSRTPSKLKGEL
jgi:hypothetical protein